MNENSRQNLLAARCGARRVTIGLDDGEELRRLSDARLLTCPGCGATVTLHAGSVRAHHFAHRPGAQCRLPQSEPETEEHRAGKLLLARWLRACLPNAEVVVEAFLPETGQRADVMLIVADASRGAGSVRRIALEFQCANLAARDWQRRHRLYRQNGIEDLWLLGGSRLHLAPAAPSSAASLAGSVLKRGEASETGRAGIVATLRTGDLERALLQANAPLLFLDAAGAHFACETLLRFRPDPDAPLLRPTGRLVSRSLTALAFPWPLLAWPDAGSDNAPRLGVPPPAPTKPFDEDAAPSPASEVWLWDWLARRFRVTPETLPACFGLPVSDPAVFACQPRLWQAAIYYRFVHRRAGDGWWLGEIESWSQAYLPLARPLAPRRLRQTLAQYQEILAAMGLLSLPVGYQRASARILADLGQLAAPPDAEEVLRLVRYRRTLARDNRPAR